MEAPVYMDTRRAVCVIATLGIALVLLISLPYYVLYAISEGTLSVNELSIRFRMQIIWPVAVGAAFYLGHLLYRSDCGRTDILVSLFLFVAYSLVAICIVSFLVIIFRYWAVIIIIAIIFSFPLYLIIRWHLSHLERFAPDILGKALLLLIAMVPQVLYALMCTIIIAPYGFRN